MTTPDTDTPKPERCRVCHGRGYLLCDCWPGDCITDLEARLAAAEAEVQRIKEINVAHCRTVNTLLVSESRMETRAKAAEAGEDALADCIRGFLHETGAYRPHERRAVTALTAYEARRKG